MNRQPSYEQVTLADLATAAHDSVRGALANGRGIRDFLLSVDRLDLAQQELIVDQAIALIQGFYVHLPLKRAMHGIDPLQRLRLLRRRLPRLGSELAFHHEMTAIFTSLRDLHTNYLLPSHFAKMAAILPFRVQACVEGGETCYVVSAVAPGWDHPSFKEGVRVRHWGGIPIERAVEIAAEAHAGSNAAARHARGVEGLTVRVLRLNPPPDEEFVIVGYDDEAGNPAEIRLDWAVIDVSAGGGGMASLDFASGNFAAGPDLLDGRAAALGVDIEIETIQRVHKMLFAPGLSEASRKMDAARHAAASAEEAEMEAVKAAVNLESTMPKVFQARSEIVDGRAVGYLRIRTFSVDDDVAFVNEAVRLLSLLPQEGLLLDVRGNGGGLIWAGERLLQLFTPKTIEPTRYAFINSAETLALVSGNDSFKPWRPAIKRALETGATYSSAFPITEPERCNDIGQVYYGPVVLITDARCYSTTDIFAAGFRDHDIGLIIGVDENMGAGGANVWTLRLINDFFADGGEMSPLRPLPLGADMRVAIRRTLRVGPELGTEVEDLGVEPDKVVNLTRRDLLEDSPELIASAARLLPAAGSRLGTERVGETGWRVSFAGIDRIDVLVDGRPISTHDINGAPMLELPLGPPGRRLELRGYRNGTLACRRFERLAA